MGTNIGKWLGIIIIVFVLGFVLLAFFKPDVLESFKEWTIRILYVVVGGTVIFIVINIFVHGKKRRK